MTAPLDRETPRAEARATQGSDEELVLRLREGEDEALRTLHQRYAALVFTVAARFVDEATAEEVVQDVFLTLWKKHEAFDPARGAFRNWIVQIARRRALNELRRKQGRGRHSDEELAQLADDAARPDEAQWLAHRRTTIRAAVDALPAAQRQALSLAFFDELTHEQIASALETPLGTTKTRIRLALKRLAPILMAVLTVVTLLFALRRREERDAKNLRALRMVTASDVVPLHLEAARGIPVEAHGSYRTRPGADVAVLTTSHLPALAAPEIYVAWAHHQSGWRSLGPVDVERDGRSVLVTDADPGAAPPDEISVTRESSPEETPHGAVVLDWVSGK